MASGPPFPPPYDPTPSPYSSTSGGQVPGDPGWLAPASLPSAPGVPGGSGRAPLYELRPLSTGEVLDRTFSLYRSRFLMFAGIASLSATVQLIGQAIQLVVQHAMLRRGNPLSLRLTNDLLSFAVSIVFLLAFAITQAATVWAMGEVYLGRSATVGGSVRATAARWLRYLGIAFWQVGSLMWLPAVVGLAFAGIWAANGRSLGVGLSALLVLLLIAASVAGLIFYLRNLLAVPVTVREGVGVRASMRRSKILADGAKGKLFLVLFIAFALYMVMAVLLGVVVFATVMVRRGAILGNLYPVQIVTLLIGFAGYTLISPVVMIGTALVYFDQRVRKEAFDVAVLLGDESAMPLPGAPVSVAPVPVVESVPFSPPLPAVPAPAGAAGTPITASQLPEQPVVEPEGGASGL